jgi:hypothetical protein
VTKGGKLQKPLAKNTAFNTLAFFAGLTADIACKIRVFTAATDSIKKQIVSFIKRP